MPLFSAFTPFGALAFSSDPSRVEKIYDANIANLNSKVDENFDMKVGTNIEAMIYARSRTQAMARYVVERAYNNANPLKATDTIPLLEKELQLAPAPHDSLQDRRAVISANSLLPNGATLVNVNNALAALLGTDFIYFYITKPADVVNFPVTGGGSPGNFVLPETVIKNYRITSNISAVIGTPIVVEYEGFVAGTPPLLNGDILVVDPAIYGMTERVDVLSATANTFVGTFFQAHDANTFATTAPYPFWQSNQRYVRIVVTAACAQDAELRRKINELMHRILRGVTKWDIVPESPTPGETEVFTIGDPVLGRLSYAPLDMTTFP